MSFDITEVIIEFSVGKDFCDEGTEITSFKHRLTGKDLDFGVVGSWLCDMEDEITFPREAGKYRACADWDESVGLIVSLYDLKRLEAI